MRRIVILAIFLLSGAAGLIYQVAWVRQATLVFGVSVYAYSAVLAAFMGGMGLGSYLLRTYADRTPRPLRAFALLQLSIAAFGVASPFILTGLMPFYAQVTRALPLDSPLVTATRALFSILVLAPPTFLMGGTLPVMARVLAQRPGRVGSDVGQLYAADTLGAALGCALTGLVLLRTLGTQQTVFLAVALNLVAAGGAWLASRQPAAPTRRADDRRERRGTQRVVSPAPVRPASTEIGSQSSQTATRRFVLAAYAVSGFVALGYEVAWARILAIFTLDAIFSFSIMLTAFLTGLTVGGWIGAAWVRRRRVSLQAFGVLQCALALTALLTLYAFARLPSVSLEGIFGDYSVTTVVLYEFLVGFLCLFIPTTLLGLLFPVVASIYTQERTEAVGANVGVVNALNTAGAILGSLAAGFLLIPLLGLQRTVVALALVNLFVGVAAAWLPAARRAGWWRVPAGASALVILLLLALPPGYYLGFREGPSDYMVFYDEGVETTVAVFDVPERNFKVSFVNGRIEVPTDEISMRAFRLLGHLPALLRPDAQAALMLSFGNGVATGSLDTHGIPRIDAVDLSAEQFRAAELYWQENYNVLRSPRLHTHVEDGRNFLLRTERLHDIITTDATHPTNTSSWALFTHEFYQQVARRLAPDGVFMQWIPFHSLREEDYRRVLRTFQAVFPHATLWYTGGSHTLLLATPERLTEETLAAHLAAAADNAFVAADLGPAAALADLQVMDEDALRTYAGTGPLVTDDGAYFLPHDEETQRILATMQAAAGQRAEQRAGQGP